jgi:excisionase family DNA binding protein
MEKQIITVGVGYDALLADIRAEMLSVLKAHVPTAATAAGSGAEPEQLLDVRQAAELLGVTWQTVHEWKRRELLPYCKMGGRTYFKRSEVLAALHSPTASTGGRATPRRGKAAAQNGKGVSK